MRSFNRIDFLVTKGNHEVKAAGEKVILDTVKGKRYQQKYDVLADQIVIYDPTTNLTLGPGDIATANAVTIAVGYDTNGDGMANALHKIGDTIDLTKGKIKSTEVPAACDQPQITDVFFSCTQSESAYSLKITLDDFYVRSRYPGQNQRAKYVYSAGTELPACKSCETPHDCQVLAQKLVDLINNDVQKNENLITYFQNQDLVERYSPFTATRLLPNGYDFCLAYDAADCDGNCGQFAGVGGIDIDGTVTDFEFTTLPGDATLSAEAHLARIVDGINTALGDAGYAHVVEPTGNCCDKRIQVMTDDSISAVRLVSDGSPVDACATFNPFDGRDETCGIRIITHPIELDLLNFVDLPPNEAVPNTFIRRIDVQPIGDGFAKDGFDVVEVQAPTPPEGLGYFWANREHKQQYPGGDYMKSFRQSKRMVGHIGLPDKYSAPMAGKVEKTGTYRVWSLEYIGGGFTFSGGASSPMLHKHLGVLLVPEADTTTHASLTPYINALVAGASVTDLTSK